MMASITTFGILVALLLAIAEPFGQARHGQSELQLRLLNGSSQVEAAYDYVIIGAGTAGLTIADHLTADGKCESLSKLARELHILTTWN